MKQKMNHLTLFKALLLISISALITSNVFSQKDEKDTEKDKRPVRSPFESALLIDNQTLIVPGKGTLEFDIMHRFGTFENGSSDFWGMWAPSNVRLGLTYSVINDLSLGIGATKFNKFVDFNVKWNFLKQTRSWSVPVGITYYGIVAIDTQSENNFDENIHRLSYFNEIIFATRFNSKLSIQLAPSISHFNAVDSLYVNDIWAISLGGRYKISSQSSVIFEYGQQLNSHEVVDSNTGSSLPRPNLAIGIEVSTSSHAFQIFIANFQDILFQKNFSANTNDFTEGIGQFLLGFNITRLWNF